MYSYCIVTPVAHSSRCIVEAGSL